MRKKLAVGSWQLAEGSVEVSQSSLPAANCQLPTSSKGFTLIELVITLMVLTILTMSVIPLVRVSVKRQREQALREALREMRTAIDQFHREALAGAAMRQPGQQQPQGEGQAAPQVQQPQGQQGVPVDPRVRVAIVDNTIFGTDNPDRYPPDLETLVNGVNVVPLASPQAGGAGGNGIAGLDNENTATSNALTATKKKIYLREIPVDPMTGERSWDLRSVYDSKDSGTWGGENVFDVRSKSNETALNGEKYSDW
ncbi:MAG TPA: type II secretion system protein [Pyrinomonadaceae bacterium]